MGTIQDAIDGAIREAELKVPKGTWQQANVLVSPETYERAKHEVVRKNAAMRRLLPKEKLEQLDKLLVDNTPHGDIAQLLGLEESVVSKIAQGMPKSEWSFQHMAHGMGLVIAVEGLPSPLLIVRANGEHYAFSVLLP